MTKTIGFAGLGVMGGHMARRVAAKFDLIVFDVDSSRMSGFPVTTASLSELGRRAGVVLFSLPTSFVVRAAVLGQGGLAETLARGSVVVDTSTTEPAVIHEIAGARRDHVRRGCRRFCLGHTERLETGGLVRGYQERLGRLEGAGCQRPRDARPRLPAGRHGGHSLEDGPRCPEVFLVVAQDLVHDCAAF
jgi:hypothetical protein